MNQSNKRPLWIRELFAITLALIMIAPICAILTSEGIKYAHRRENEHLSIRTKLFEDVATDESRVSAAAEEWFDRNLSASIRLMTDSLKAFASNGGYSGPRMISDGFVLAFEGERAVFPEEMGEVEAQISRALVEQSVASGAMRTGRLVKQPGQADAVPSPLDVTGVQQSAEPEAFYLSFGKIADELYYVDMTAEAEYRDYMAGYERIDYDRLEKANQVFNSNTMLVEERDGHLELLSAYGSIEKFQSLAEMGISEEQLRQEPELLRIDGVSYRCVYSRAESESPETPNVTMIQMLPIVSLGMKSLNRALAIGYTMALSFVTMLVYMFAVRRCVRDTELTNAQAKRYSPRKLRVIMISAAATGVIAVFAVASILQGLGQIYVETKYGQDTLAMFIRQMDQSVTAVDEEDARQQEEWYVYHGQSMASLLNAHQGFATRETLQRWCDILNIDFIMLFDANGNETLCNRDYSGFTLNKGLGNNSSDFHRLLLGIPSIVHEASTDATTGLERQIIGVTLPMADGAHGALIMALLPEHMQNVGGSTNLNSQLAAMTVEGAECFVVDEASNTVTHTSDDALQGARILERGLSEKSLRDGYMDFGTLDGDECYVMTARNGNNIYYYAVRCSTLFQSVLKFGGIAAVLYGLVAAVMLLIFFRDYTQRAYDNAATVTDSGDVPFRWGGEALEAEDVDEGPGSVRTKKLKYTQAAEQRLMERARDGRVQEGLQKLRNAVKWDEEGPEGKAGMVFRLGMIVLLIGWANLIARSDLTSKGSGSMVSFLLQGNWAKGVNPFAVCTATLIISLAYLVNVISGLALKLLSNFLLNKGKTICRLVHNAIKYLSVFVSVYFVLLCFGFPIGTVVGSIGIVSLALSLGAKDMAADVLAGLSIVFEKSFEVGDIVEIGNLKGVVQQIGVRSTKLLTLDNNAVTISNHSISTVVNLSRRLSWYALCVKIDISSSIEEIEVLLNRELPEIGKRCPGIVGELHYRGIREFGGGSGGVGISMRAPTVTLLIDAQCNEKDLEDVNLFVSREVLLLLKREGIAIR